MYICMKNALKNCKNCVCSGRWGDICGCLQFVWPRGKIIGCIYGQLEQTMQVRNTANHLQFKFKDLERDFFIFEMC